MKEDVYIKCDFCGRFISYESLENGSASRSLITPDSDYSIEEFESVCKYCQKNEGQRT